MNSGCYECCYEFSPWHLVSIQKVDDIPGSEDEFSLICFSWYMLTAKEMIYQSRLANQMLWDRQCFLTPFLIWGGGQYYPKKKAARSPWMVLDISASLETHQYKQPPGQSQHVCRFVTATAGSSYIISNKDCQNVVQHQRTAIPRSSPVFSRWMKKSPSIYCLWEPVLKKESSLKKLSCRRQ